MSKSRKKDKSRTLRKKDLVKFREVPKYAFVVYYSAEDRAWLTDVPDFTFIQTDGKTPKKAVKELMEVLRLVVTSSRLDHDDYLPMPEFHQQSEEIKGLELLGSHRARFDKGEKEMAEFKERHKWSKAYLKKVKKERKAEERAKRKK